MHPILFHIGSFQLPTYGVLLATALILALYTVVRLGRREGLDTGRLIDFSTWVIVAALVGAKALMILTEWGYYREHPGDIFSMATLEAGGVFYGGFMAAALFGVWYLRTYKLPLRKVFDICAPAVALGQGIGRLGCFAAGDDYGKPTHSFWGVVFTDPYAHQLSGTPLGVPLYPVQLFESAICLGIFAFLLWWYGRKSRDGEIFLFYIVLYAMARFFLEFIRGDADRGFVFHHLLSTSQFIALLALVAAGILAWFWYVGQQVAASVGSEGVSGGAEPAQGSGRPVAR